MMWSVYNQRNLKMSLTKITWFLFLIYIKLLIIIIYSYKKKIENMGKLSNWTNEVPFKLILGRLDIKDIF